MEKKFNAFEYQANRTFEFIPFRYVGSEQKGWKIYREEKFYLSLGEGYVLAKTLCCGICATDLTREKLPFPLPQITGHEFVVEYDDGIYAVEINASHQALGVGTTDCAYCSAGLGIHCPHRLTLGIDRLPGGFSPWVLVPRNALKKLPEFLTPEQGCLIEPLAAALHAVKQSQINSTKRIAVVGVGRLGLLLLFILIQMRNLHQLNIEINAIVRSQRNVQLLNQLGVDRVTEYIESEDAAYDLVFDTSGSVKGFDTALKVSRDRVHIKSTSGQCYQNVCSLTQFVVDELSLNVVTSCDDVFSCVKENLNQGAVLIDERLREIFLNHALTSISQVAFVDFDSEEQLFPVKSCSIAVLTDVTNLDKLILNLAGSRVKPRGKIFIWGANGISGISNTFQALLTKKLLTLESSRCGSFSDAIEFIKLVAPQFQKFSDQFITHRLGIADIEQGFDLAKSSQQALKVVLVH